MKNKIKKLNIPIWPIIHPEVIFSLCKIYFSQNWSWWGKYEVQFIKKFLKIHTAKYAALTVSGTMAIENALYAAGIKAGDEVIVPAYTWITTVTPIVKIGAIPVFVDIDAKTLCISPQKIEEAVTEKTKAIIPVHLYSAIADMDKIIEIANKYNLKVIEDCAHAHGAIYKNKPVGTFGLVSAFSFQQSKLLTSGEGGICITNDINIAAKLDKISHIGCSILDKFNRKDYTVPYNKCNITEFQAAVLSNQCNYLLKENFKREENAELLRNMLKDVEIIRFQESSEGTTARSYYNFVILINTNKLKSGITVHNIINDLIQDGLYAQNGYYSLVYDYNLWNISEDKYIKKDNTTAQNLSKELITFPHTLLLADKKTIKIAAEIIRKNVTKYID